MFPLQTADVVEEPQPCDEALGIITTRPDCRRRVSVFFYIFWRPLGLESTLGIQDRHGQTRQDCHISVRVVFQQRGLQGRSFFLGTCAYLEIDDAGWPLYLQSRSKCDVKSEAGAKLRQIEFIVQRGTIQEVAEFKLAVYLYYYISHFGDLELLVDQPHIMEILIRFFDQFRWRNRNQRQRLNRILWSKLQEPQGQLIQIAA